MPSHTAQAEWWTKWWAGAWRVVEKDPWAEGSTIRVLVKSFLDLEVANDLLSVPGLVLFTLFTLCTGASAVDG